MQLKIIQKNTHQKMRKLKITLHYRYKMKYCLRNESVETSAYIIFPTNWHFYYHKVFF